MDLVQLSQFIDKKRKEFEFEVKKSSKRLRLSDVTKEIHLNTFEFTQGEKSFKEGQKLDFILQQGHYHVYVDREKLVLTGKYEIEVARFTGAGVRKFYDGLSSKILKAIEEEDVPF